MDEVLKLQFALLGIKHQVGEIDEKKIDWKRFFIDASNNRILYHVSRELLSSGLKLNEYAIKKIHNEITPKGEDYIAKTKRALEYLKKELCVLKKDFLVCKTQKIFNYVTFDVDCLFKKNEYEEILEYLRSRGGKRVECPSKLQADIIRDNMVRMDMHDGFHWQGSDFVDSSNFWDRSVKKEVFSVPEIKTPDITDEWMLTILNLIYERHYIPLIDYHYLLQIKEQIDWKKVFETAQKFHWKQGLIILMKKFNTIHFSLFGKPITDLPQLKKMADHTVKIPYIFTYKELAMVFWERISKCKYLPLYELLYAIFAKTRYHMAGRFRVPIYGHWIDFK